MTLEYDTYYMSHPKFRLARKARPRRTTSRNNANLVYEDVINATKENLNQSGERFKWTFLIGHLVFTNESVGRGVQRLVDKEKKGLVQREEEFPVYDGQPAVKKARVSRTKKFILYYAVKLERLEHPQNPDQMTYGLSIGLLLYSLYKINSI